MSYRLGRLPATRPAALSDLTVYAEGKLRRPPRTIEVPNTVYPIDGNDRYGDCVMAGVSHCLEAWNVEVKQHDPVPTEQAVVQEYLKLSPQDEGLNESEVLNLWYREGLFGRRIAGYAPVSTTSLLAQHQAVAFYGACFLGIECPVSAQEAFEEQARTGKTVPWVYEGGEIAGGHAVIALGYGPNGGLHCATWGGIAVLEASFLAHYLDEAWVILSDEVVKAQKDALGIDLASLRADLARV